MSTRRRIRVERDNEVQVFGRLTDLATAPVLSRGVRVFVAETQETFYCVGITTPTIAAHIGWYQENIWLPDHAKQHMERKHPEISDHLRAIEVIVSNPITVNDVPGEPNQLQFFANGDHLRAEGLIVSTSILTVDVLIELRPVHGEIYLRAYHLSPMRRTKGGRQRWP